MLKTMEENGVASIRLTRTIAQKRIRLIAQVTGNVILTKHAKERMAERDINKREIFRVLRCGDVDGEPQQTDSGEWKCKVIQQLRGRRVAGVVVALLRNGTQLSVMTVEWEDGK